MNINEHTYLYNINNGYETSQCQSKIYSTEL